MIRKENSLTVTFIDVGNSDAILLNIYGNYLLIDGGNDNSSSVYLSYLNGFDKCHISNLILTHPHKDHLFGLHSILKNCELDFLHFNNVSFDSKLYGDFLSTVNFLNNNFITQSLYKDDQILINDVSLDILWPPKKFRDENINNESIVLLLSYNDFEILFLADLESEVQQFLLDDVYLKNIDLPLEVIKVPHQGSIDALNKDLLNFLKPRVAIFSVGENSFGHPNPFVTAYYEDLGAVILRTDQHGSITVNIPKMPSEQ